MENKSKKTRKHNSSRFGRVHNFTMLLGAVKANDHKEIEKLCEKLDLPLDKSKLVR